MRKWLAALFAVLFIGLTATSAAADTYYSPYQRCTTPYTTVKDYQVKLRWERSAASATAYGVQWTTMTGTGTVNPTPVVQIVADLRGSDGVTGYSYWYYGPTGTWTGNIPTTTDYDYRKRSVRGIVTLYDFQANVICTATAAYSG